MIPASLTSFRDATVQPDHCYHYLVACGYQASPGHMAWSVAQGAEASPGRWPQPVTEVHATATTSGGGVVLRWDSPGEGSIAVLDVASGVPAPVSDMTADAAASLGTVCWRGEAGPPGSPMRCEVLLPGQGLHHLVIVTLLKGRAVTGAVQAADVLEGVRNTAYLRTGDTAQLSWEWPASLSQALVRWSYPGEPSVPAQTERVTRDGYRRRGVKLPAGDSVCTVTVTPLSTVAGSVSVGAPGIIDVAPEYELSYELRHGRRGGPIRSVDLRVSGTAPVTPAFVLIARPGLVRPTRADQGSVILRVDVADLPAARVAGYPVGPLAIQPPCYLRGFVTGPGAGSFRLAHPDRSQLRVER